MKLKNLKIDAQLRIGLGIIMALVIFLGALTWQQTDQLWLQTKGLYEHPLMVRRAVDKIMIDTLIMHRDMKDLVLAENEQEKQSLVQDLDVREADAFGQFDILYDRYLGPRNDIDETRNHFVQWKSIRDETIRLLRAGKTAEALRRTKSDGIGGGHMEKILKEAGDISAFSKNKGDQFYSSAEAQNNALRRQLGVIVAVILLLSLIVVWLQLKGIKTPLSELTSTADRFSRGELDARSRYASTNEFGTLSDSFNALAEMVQIEWQSRESATRITEIMLNQEDMRTFCRILLKVLLTETGSQIGAIYILNEEKTAFDLFESIGLALSGRASFSAAGFEGEFGAALTTGQIQHITDIPADTRFTFASVAGDFQPREIITIPLSGDGEIAAVISLANVRSYPAHAVRLVQRVWDVLTARWNGVLSFRKIHAIAEQLKKQNRELQTQQEKLEQQQLALEGVSRLKSQFLSNMSHELRTPLNSVMALSRVVMMQARTKLGAEEVNYLEIIERNGKNLLTLINDILDLSKIEAGRMDVNPKPFSLAQTLENIIESIAPLAAEKQIELHQEIPEDLPSLESDEIRVSQILQNLVVNAVKFTDAGSVTVSVESDGGKVYVRIADTGIGIAENDLPYIFDEFRQVDGTSARRHEGTGLGLAIARKAVRILDGDIAVQSAPGKGSTFILTLPLTWQGTAAVYEPIVRRQPQAVKSKRRTILVVDNEPAMAAMISRYLLQEGYNTLTATSGTEALELAARERPFAITLDIIMPDMDGWEVLQGLKKNPETKDIPVIIVSISEDRETGFALGAFGYVTKPVSNKLLISEIQKIGKPGTRSIMIVDDNDLDRQQIRRIIEEEGLKPIVAENGAACLELITKQVPDVLVLDLMMPELDGFAVLERIRSNPATRDLPVIVVTAKDLTEEDREKLRGNVFSVLEKSAATSETLLAEIKRILMDLEGLPKHPEVKKPAAPPRILIVDDKAAILIVEDNPDDMTTIKAVLRNRYRILEATDGEEGLRMAEEARPDLILLDMALPKMDGLAVVRHLKGNKELSPIPVIAMTAQVMKGDRERILDGGCDDYIAKPIDPEGFLEKISEWLKG